MPEGLDVVELRALWFSLPHWDSTSSNPLEVRKAEWKEGVKSKLDNQVYRMIVTGNLPNHLKRNPVYEVNYEPINNSYQFNGIIVGLYDNIYALR